MEGLEDLAEDELRQICGRDLERLMRRRGALTFRLIGRDGEGRLNRLKLTQAIYRVLDFPVPRPRALLGDQHFRALVEQSREITERAGRGQFATLHLAAAGAETAVMRRLRNDLARALGLVPDDEKGDLWLRVRPSPEREGWQALLRLSFRPLATREWRVCNYEGALNATVAHAMIKLAGVTANQTVINPGCGSGTLLIEGASAVSSARYIGVDHRSDVLECAARNIRASGFGGMMLLHADNRWLPIAPRTVDALVADLPFGQRTGSHEDNLALYPALLAEAARIGRPGARFVLITHEIRLIERVLAEQRAWRMVAQRMITLRGLHPRIYTLQLNL